MITKGSYPCSHLPKAGIHGAVLVLRGDRFAGKLSELFGKTEPKGI